MRVCEALLGSCLVFSLIGALLNNRKPFTSSKKQEMGSGRSGEDVT